MTVPGAGAGRRISERKREHLDLALEDAAQSGVPPGWDDVALVPAALAGVSPADIDLSAELMGHRLGAPVVVAGMTGGHPAAGPVNAALGAAAEQLGLAVGVGSQRAALVAPELAASFAAVRERAPDVLVIANVGACQLVDQGDTPALTPAEVERAVGMVGAGALAVHLNVVQELVQTEGDRRFDGLEAAIARLVEASPVPVLVKETGAGIDRDSAARLAGAGVAAIDVGGVGGTGFARVEGARAAGAGDRRGARLGRTFADWGIPTAASVLEVRGAGVAVVATGGVRTGLDAARALALGARAVGVGRPAVTAARRGEGAVVEELGLLVEELRTALVLCGARRPADLPAPVLGGRTLEWARQRGLG